MNSGGFRSCELLFGSSISLLISNIISGYPFLVIYSTHSIVVSAFPEGFEVGATWCLAHSNNKSYDIRKTCQVEEFVKVDCTS